MPKCVLYPTVLNIHSLEENYWSSLSFIQTASVNQSSHYNKITQQKSLCTYIHTQCRWKQNTMQVSQLTSDALFFHFILPYSLLQNQCVTKQCNVQCKLATLVEQTHITEIYYCTYVNIMKTFSIIWRSIHFVAQMFIKIISYYTANTCGVSITNTKRLLLFTLRIIWNTPAHSVRKNAAFLNVKTGGVYSYCYAFSS